MGDLVKRFNKNPLIAPEDIKPSLLVKKTEEA